MFSEVTNVARLLFRQKEDEVYHAVPGLIFHYHQHLLWLPVEKQTVFTCEHLNACIAVSSFHYTQPEMPTTLTA